MKKNILVLLCSCLPLIGMAEFVSKDFSDLNITIEEVISYADSWFGTGNSEFILFYDAEDELGYRHQNYQQYLDGTLVENCALYVHSFNGKVTLINGDIMRVTSQPSATENTQARKVAKALNPDNESEEIVIIHIGDQFYRTYKISQPQEDIYVDIETGEIVQKLSKVFMNNVSCTMPTIYNGTKTVDCDYSNGSYHLYDSKRNVRVLYGDMGPNFTPPSTIYEIINDSKDWSGHNLTSATITKCRNNWWGSFGDVNPDLYLTIENSSGQIVYTTDYKSDATTVPLVFNFSIPIEIPSNGGYQIKVWDQDLTSDELGMTVNINGNTCGTYSWGKSSDNVEGQFIIQQASPMYDAYWGIVNAHKFYQDQFSINSFDNKGTLVQVFLHAPTYGAINKEEGYQTLGFLNYKANYNNAFADCQRCYITFGMGNEKGNPEVGYNTVCHEFTHLVTAFRPNGILVYQGESGALNEGYSDAFAEYAEYVMFGKVDWLYDTDTKLVDANYKRWDYVRNIKNPKAGGPEGYKPNTYKGDYWAPTNGSEDYGGVHMNNSIFTYWFYLLSEGGSGTNDNGNTYVVDKIGIEKAAKIAWRMHRVYLPAQATFAEARKYAIQSAKDLYANDKSIEKAVTNAWYAVGVGNKYVTSEDEEFKLTPGKYAIVATRATDADKNWYYLSATTAVSKTRLDAVSTGTDNINSINLKNLSSDYVWDLVADGSNWKLKNGSQYITWESGNTAKLGIPGKSLTFEIAENQVQAHFYDGTAERYLSLNRGYDYFAFYANTGQITHLYFLPIEDQPTPPTPAVNEYYIVAKRSTGNYYFFTPDKVSGKDRLIAVDAGTSIRSKVDTVNTSSAYLWTLEDSGSGKLLKNHNGSYLTCTEAKTAAMASTGKVLKVTNNTDGTTTFSYAADASTTHYLSLANAGNDYFVFYANTNQVTHLLLMPKGSGAATNIEDVLESPKPKKFMRDGQILIERCDGFYNMMGQKVR